MQSWCNLENLENTENIQKPIKITMNFTIQFKHCKCHYASSLCVHVCECVCEFL